MGDFDMCRHEVHQEHRHSQQLVASLRLLLDAVSRAVGHGEDARGSHKTEDCALAWSSLLLRLSTNA